MGRRRWTLKLRITPRESSCPRTSCRTGQLAEDFYRTIGIDLPVAKTDWRDASEHTGEPDGKRVRAEAEDADQEPRQFRVRSLSHAMIANAECRQHCEAYSVNDSAPEIAEPRGDPLSKASA